MSRKITTAEYIDRCVEKHGDKFDYTMTTYVDQNTKVTVTCPTHGDWECLPNNHSHLGQGCPLCGRRSGGIKRTLPFEDFVKQARLIHGDKYEYVADSYATTQTKTIIVCPSHGEFHMKPNSHISGRQGCPQCANKHKTTKRWIADFIVVHGNTYDYTNTVVKKSHEKATIRCRIHGEFQQTPAMHKSGQGCPLCGYANHKGRYSSYYFDNHPTQRATPATLYVIECSNDFEHFIKVGITTTSVANRIRNNGIIKYSVRILSEYSLNLYDAFSIEQTILDRCRDFAYTPGEYFQGKTECLHPSCYGQIIKTIQENNNDK